MLLITAFVPGVVHAAADGVSMGNLTFQVLSPTSLPQGLTVSTSAAPVAETDDPGNTGNGSVSYVGSSAIATGDDLGSELHLNSSAVCNASQPGQYGGHVHASGTFTAQNSGEVHVPMTLVFYTSWSATAAADNPGAGEESSAGTELTVPLPQEWLPTLVPGNCDDGYLNGNFLTLGQGSVDTSGGNAGDGDGPSTCQVEIVVPRGGVERSATMSSISVCNALAPAVAVPTVSLPALLVLAVGLLAAGWRTLRFRSSA